MRPMKLMALCVLTMTVSVSQGAVREMMIGISDALIPRARSTAEASIIVTGVFPNGCYRWSRAAVTEISTQLHEVRSFANVQSGMCIMVLVPFMKEVSLGRLVPGQHTLRFVSGDGTYFEKQMLVE